METNTRIKGVIESKKWNRKVEKEKVERRKEGKE